MSPEQEEGKAPEKKKRKRRSKAEMDAARAEKAAKTGNSDKVPPKEPPAEKEKDQELFVITDNDDSKIVTQEQILTLMNSLADEPDSNPRIFKLGKEVFLKVTVKLEEKK